MSCCLVPDIPPPSRIIRLPKFVPAEGVTLDSWLKHVDGYLAWLNATDNERVSALIFTFPSQLYSELIINIGEFHNNRYSYPIWIDHMKAYFRRHAGAEDAYLMHLKNL